MTDQQITALVTGANRGLGKRFAAQLVERGAKVYAAARRPETIDIPGVNPRPARHHRSRVGRPRCQFGRRRQRTDQQRGGLNKVVTAHRADGGCAPGDGDALLRHALRDPRVRSDHRSQRRRSDPQRAVGVVVVARSGIRRLFGSEGSVVGDDGCPPRRSWPLAASTSPRCTSASWTPTWPTSSRQTRRPIPRWSPNSRWTVCSRASLRSSPTTRRARSRPSYPPRLPDRDFGVIRRAQRD